jgi:hypothetical protein
MIEDRFDVDPRRSGRQPNQQRPPAQPIRHPWMGHVGCAADRLSGTSGPHELAVLVGREPAAPVSVAPSRSASATHRERAGQPVTPPWRSPSPDGHRGHECRAWFRIAATVHGLIHITAVVAQFA